MNRLFAISCLCVVLTACGGSEASIAESSEEGGEAEQELAAIPTGNPLNATEYFVDHGQDSAVTNTANRPEGTHPYGGPIPGFFNPGGSTGPVAEAGKPLTFVYDRYESISYIPAPQCFDEVSGTWQPCGSESSSSYEYHPYLWRELQYRIDGGNIETLLLPHGMPGGQINIPVSATGEVEYWFKLTRSNGTVEWDSRWGANYRINILPAATTTITFDQDWKIVRTGPIEEETSVKLDYDRDRLVDALLRATNTPSNTNYSMKISAFVSFDGKQAAEYPVDIGFSVMQAPLVEVPRNTNEMKVWFKGSIRVYVNNRAEWRDVYDSNYGANYAFAIAH